MERQITHCDTPVPPRGTTEDSPPFQRWVSWHKRSGVPRGRHHSSRDPTTARTAENLSSALRDWFCALHPPSASPDRPARWRQRPECYP